MRDVIVVKVSFYFSLLLYDTQCARVQCEGGFEMITEYSRREDCEVKEDGGKLTVAVCRM